MMADERHPLPCKILAQSDLPLFKKRQLNMNNNNDDDNNINNKQIWVASEKYALPLISPNGGSKHQFTIFVNKTKIPSKEVCYKVFSVENFHQQI